MAVAHMCAHLIMYVVWTYRAVVAADDVCRIVRRHPMPCGVPKLSHTEHQTYVCIMYALMVSPRRSFVFFCWVSVVRAHARLSCGFSHYISRMKNIFFSRDDHRRGPVWAHLSR